MSEAKIVALDGRKVSPQTLLHQVLERDDFDGVVMVVRIDGRWNSCWSAGVSLASLSMASLKLTADVTHAIHETDEGHT